MKLIPCGDHIVVKRDELEEATPGGIFLPNISKSRPHRGTVLAVGADHAESVGVGDSVLFVAYAGHEFTMDGNKKVVLLKESDILAVLAD